MFSRSSSMEKKAHHEPRKLSYLYLKKITNDFDVMLEADVFGTVYKGVDENRGEIAVKLLHNYPGLEDEEFHRELYNLREIKHPNVVELVGFCNESEKEFAVFEGKIVLAERFRRALCLEYVQNGSLNKLISDETTGLTWQTRYKIIKGICEGLKYLHEGREFPIMHFDLKPGNILLDKNMVPKISNFGSSRIFGEEVLKRTMSSVGTMGYWPPEYITDDIISKQFDIFSLGVTIIQIMVGREGYNYYLDMSTRKFATLVHKNWRKRLYQSNTQLLQVYCYQVMRCTEIALDCLELNRHERPTINNIISNLSETETMFGDQLQIEKFFQDDSSESIILPSRSRFTSRPSSGHAEAGRFSHTSNYLWDITEPKVMAFEELRRITNGFSDERLLGKGGYGMVYEGVLDNGEKIAVKKLHNNPGLVGKQFENELVNLAMLQHQNIIRLVGYSSETRDRVVKYEGKYVIASLEERALCLEYMPGGTLEELLSDESGGLDWDARSQIIKGLCNGLKYLHTGSKDPICHMDLKPANILLDNDMIPKIGDFGLSKLMDTTKTCVAEKAIGTRGYMPPEYIDGLEFSPKFDVFSLGVIIIEVIAGPNAYNNYKSEFMTSQVFTEKVTRNWRKREHPEPMLMEALVLEVQRCMKIALRCVEEDRVKRPNITEIVEELNMIDMHPALFAADSEDDTTPAALST